MDIPPLHHTPTYFALTDSHGKYVPSFITAPTHSIHVMAISGLQWVNTYNPALSAVTLLSTPPIHQRISSSAAVMFLIGTNATRSTCAATIITQVSNFIQFLRSQHHHLTDKHCVNLILCFPCLKPIYPLNTVSTLSHNIDQYNSMLIDLANTLNFTVVDFHVTAYHLGRDQMHLAPKHKPLIENCIAKYFTSMSSIPTSAPTTVIGRSAEAKARRNQRRHAKSALKQRQCFLTRPIHASWSILTSKAYLHNCNIKFAKIPPIHRNILRIQFNNFLDLQVADAAIAQDAFVEPFCSHH